jgi:hypothetical protein
VEEGLACTADDLLIRATKAFWLANEQKDILSF